MRVHVAYIQGAYLREYDKTFVPMFYEDLRHYGPESGLMPEADPSRADVVILWEGAHCKTPDYLRVLESDPLIRGNSERIYTINYDDHPAGFLSGVYTSLEHPFFDSSTHRVWPFFVMNNDQVYGLDREDVLRWNPKLLFSFMGAASHPLREKLFKVYSGESPAYRVENVKKWYNHDNTDRRQFLNIALDSVFCLCPRGYCSYTQRITEVMAMARVPVIIADDWIPFSFPDKSPYYIRVPEKDIEHLPDILSGRRSEAEELRRNARAIWEKYCSIRRRAAAIVECFKSISEEARLSFSDYCERWHSQEFLGKLGWTFKQRMALRLEQHVNRLFPEAEIKVPYVSALMRYRNARPPRQ